ncbi:MAG: tetratricopeptide repeat protein, partial [Candidatus Lokiarchaeota archaeon]|nr:tetratricopeptide repeat protein [Candidatus Lokiarchaeota archaeon]
MNGSALDIQKVIAGDERPITFLVGAGCSVESPSCISSGRQMIEALVNQFCPETELGMILGMKDLRYEEVVERIRDVVDHDLNIIDYFSLCDKPNAQHFFLAAMMKKGHYVMTTNFDFLVEQALLASGVARDDVVPVITRQDFEHYGDPAALVAAGKVPLYKVHGSVRNFITGEDTRAHLVTTIQAFGSNKAGLNVFQLEPYKRDALTNLTADRSLIVVGYSGSDDFDIVPTLNALKFKEIIWLNFVGDDDGAAKIEEVVVDQGGDRQTPAEKVTSILLDIKGARPSSRVYRIDVNTSRLVRSVLDQAVDRNQPPFAVTVKDFLKDRFGNQHDFIKLNLACTLYHHHGRYEEALRCGQEGLKLSRELGVKRAEAVFLNCIGLAHLKRNEGEKAREAHEQAMSITATLPDDQKNRTANAVYMINLASSLHEANDLSRALAILNEALGVVKEKGNVSLQATCLNNIGTILSDQGHRKESIEKLEEAMALYRQNGDLNGVATVLGQIGLSYFELGDVKRALSMMDDALKINEQLGNVHGQGVQLSNMAQIYQKS